jgi:hypothetical protein
VTAKDALFAIVGGPEGRAVLDAIAAREAALA